MVGRPHHATPVSTEPTTDDAHRRLEEERDEVMELGRDALRRRLELCPADWRQPLSDVFSTYETCELKLLSMHGSFCAQDAIALTRMVLERKARDEDRADAEWQALTEESGQ